MSPSKRYAKKQAKARQRRRLQAHARLERDRHQAQQAAEALYRALEELGLSVRPARKGSRGSGMTEVIHCCGGNPLPCCQFVEPSAETQQRPSLLAA